MRTKLKNRLTIILILLCFFVVSAISVTIIFALTQQYISTQIGVEYYPTTSIEIFTFKDNGDGTCSVVSFDATYQGEIDIPETYNNLSVTSISAQAFKDSTSLTSITIPASVTSIGSQAFVGCSSLSSIVVEEGNTSYHVAGDCLIETNTKKIIKGFDTSVIPTDGTVTQIGDYAFDWCTELTSLSIPASITSIGSEAFRNCWSLSDITLNTMNANVRSAIISYSLNNQPVNLTIGNNITTIPNNAFDCSSYSIGTGMGIKSVVVGNNVKTIGDNAFNYCIYLENVTISNSVTTLGENSFNCCTYLSNVVFGNNVTTIGDYAFYSCEYLTNITLPNSLTTIGSGAFAMSGLTYITIPSSVTKIKAVAFWGCSLENATFNDVDTWYVIEEEYISETYVNPNDLSYGSIAAEYLISTYVDYDWEKR